MIIVYHVLFIITTIFSIGNGQDLLIKQITLKYTANVSRELLIYKIHQV